MPATGHGRTTRPRPSDNERGRALPILQLCSHFACLQGGRGKNTHLYGKDHHSLLRLLEGSPACFPYLFRPLPPQQWPIEPPAELQMTFEAPRPSGSEYEDHATFVETAQASMLMAALSQAVITVQPQVFPGPAVAIQPRFMTREQG